MRALIIRTHGIPLQLSREISLMGCEIIDATCPFVKKAQYYAKLLMEEGYQVVILGEKNHPEVKGLMSYANDDVIVVDSKTPLPKLKNKIGIVVQTTQPLEVLKRVLSDALEHSSEIKVYNTICNSTALRLRETEKMARMVDVMFVVGGKNSANTTQLTRRFQDIPYPVPGVPSPAGKRNVDLEEHRLVVGFGSCQRPCPEQQQGSKQKDHSEISMFHVITPQVKDTLH